MKRECESCIKRKTVYCPTSMECMATDDMPYYQNRIMLLEENEQLKEKINKAIEYIEKFIPIGEDTILMREKQRDYLLDILNEVSE